MIRSPGLIPFVLSDQDNSYAIFLRSVGTVLTKFEIKTKNGDYEIIEINTLIGNHSNPKLVSVKNGVLSADIDIPEGELAMIINRVN